MKKKKLTSLTLNKQKISQLHELKGGETPVSVVPTYDDACFSDFCKYVSIFVCPPPETEFCTVECQTQDCTFVNC
ncbi:hypothetical protein C8N46_11115 [Kordia periserrulae]|uniref:Uncharacterized protein n=1 Tax=Kordia periserrulae TaxID=701523 RepID=A0A2T6BSF3_9FLAO|nr:hypothetical protein [Kordia periserrulae]PTX58946.1 hypothetical protein C8N46_11115 [Kordia periserrulae]